LITGGSTGSRTLSSAEVFDPATAQWSPTGAMPTSTATFGIVELPTGKVLVAGGASSDQLEYPTAAMLYDPVKGTWGTTGAMAQGRDDFSLTSLPDGTVLAAGGVGAGGVLTEAERYDPRTQTWSPTGSMHTARYSNQVAALPDGRVLEVGGFDGTTLVATTELYDPTSGTWSDGPSMGGTRGFATVAALQDGRVLAAGGFGSSQAGADLFTPSTTRTADGGDFGTQAVGSSTEQDVTVRVTGAGRLFADSATITGPDAADFAIVSDGCTSDSLAAGQSCTIRVRFSPGAAGARTASLVLADNADPANPIALPGAGAATTSGGTPTPTPTPTPMPTPSPTPQPTPTPTPELACVSRRLFEVAIHRPKGTRLESGTATLNGRRIARLNAKSRRVRVDLRGEPAGVYTLRLTFTTSTGHRITEVHRYRTCTPRR
jgi:hypothetical protein